MSAEQTTHSTDAHRRWRYTKDRMARYGVAVGGFGVITALILIFVYLFYVVLPLFEPARIERAGAFAMPGGGQSLYLAVEEQNEIALRVTADGGLVFFATRDGKLRHQEQLPILTALQPAVAASPAAPTTAAPPAAEPVPQREVVLISEVNADQGMLAAGLDDGSVLLFGHSYGMSYPNNVKTITPEVKYPYGQEPVPVVAGKPVALAVRDSDDQLLVAAAAADDTVTLRAIAKQTSLIDESATLTPSESVSIASAVHPKFLLINPLQEWLYVASGDGKLAYYDVRNPARPELLQTVELLADGTRLEQLSFLAGGFSIVASGSDGRTVQWFPVRDEQNRYQLKRVRDFQPEAGASGYTSLTSELRRRGFFAGTADGSLGIYYATSGRVVLEEDVSDRPLRRLAVSPRATLLLAEEEGGQILAYRIHNEHPEVSWNALWGKVWYEGYSGPDFNWQSTAASNDFEPKLSLAPLTYGTIKGAFYAMLFAVPLAILAAIYTAYFMAPRMRQSVKPTVEVMQALPTVVLGFLAGLWLAPIVEENLPGVFGILLLGPVVMILAGMGWSRLPGSVRQRIPDGWEGALLIPVLLVFAWLCFQLGRPLEIAVFGGNLPAWLDQTMGIDYDQRNCLVVGFAMGFAVIPTIFSISEDAIFGVPRHLSNGSLALGATPWQTLIGVVLPTASPGIFSALMIGMGRAVGETMIVLMATGNTPVMDFSMFSGMRTLSANIAVEMPESEVGSTHFRILFLAGLVLFMVTFMLNTLAEIVRQRLREKYSNI